MQQHFASVLQPAEVFFADAMAREQLSNSAAHLETIGKLAPGVLRGESKNDRRETCELRPMASAWKAAFESAEAPPSMVALGAAAQNAANAAHELCVAVLTELRRTCNDAITARALAAATDKGADDALGPSVLRLHRYAGGGSSSDDGAECSWSVPSHYDFGLLSLLPRSTVAALEVLHAPLPLSPSRLKTTKTEAIDNLHWVQIEERMAHDEVLVFAGALLAHVDPTVVALAHRVRGAPTTPHEQRFSAAYFARSTLPSLSAPRGVAYEGPPDVPLEVEALPVRV